MPVTAGVTEDLGSEIHVLFTIDAPQVQHSSITDAILRQTTTDEAIPLDGGKSLWTARVAARSKVRPGQPIELAVDTSNLQFFDPESGLSIGHPQATPDRAGRRALQARDNPAARGSRVSDLPITTRWIWLVPSTICSTLASRISRSAGKSST